MSIDLELETKKVESKSHQLKCRMVTKWKGRRFVYRIPWQWKIEPYLSKDSYDPDILTYTVTKLTKEINDSVVEDNPDYFQEACREQITQQICQKHGIGPITRQMRKLGLNHHGNLAH